MSNQTKVGILGCASIAKRSLAPAFDAHPQFSIQSIGSRTLSSAIEFSSIYNALPCSYDEVICNSDVDLVYCPLPTGLHYEWVKKCLQNGKHVLCEKSLALNFNQVKELVGLAREKHLFLMESFQFRFHPQNIYVKSLLDKNAIGQIRSLDVKFGFPPFPDGLKNIRYSSKLGGGALLDAGAYVLKCSTYLLGNDLIVLNSIGGVCPGYEVDLDGHILLKSKDGIVSNASYGFHNFYQCGYEIWGERGKITTTRAFTARPDFDAKVVVETELGVEEHTFKADHFALMLDYVADCIEHNKFEHEYEECLIQSNLLTQAKQKMGI